MVAWAGAVVKIVAKALRVFTRLQPFVQNQRTASKWTKVCFSIWVFLFGVRRLDAALDFWIDASHPKIQSGVEPPHSKNPKRLFQRHT